MAVDDDDSSLTTYLGTGRRLPVVPSCLEPLTAAPLNGLYPELYCRGLSEEREDYAIK